METFFLIVDGLAVAGTCPMGCNRSLQIAAMSRMARAKDGQPILSGPEESLRMRRPPIHCDGGMVCSAVMGQTMTAAR